MITMSGYTFGLLLVGAACIGGFAVLIAPVHQWLRVDRLVRHNQRILDETLRLAPPEQTTYRARSHKTDVREAWPLPESPRMHERVFAAREAAARTALAAAEHEPAASVAPPVLPVPISVAAPTETVLIGRPPMEAQIRWHRDPMWSVRPPTAAEDTQWGRWAAGEAEPVRREAEPVRRDVWLRWSLLDVALAAVLLPLLGGARLGRLARLGVAFAGAVVVTYLPVHGVPAVSHARHRAPEPDEPAEQPEPVREVEPDDAWRQDTGELDLALWHLTTNHRSDEQAYREGLARVYATTARTGGAR